MRGMSYEPLGVPSLAAKVTWLAGLAVAGGLVALVTGLTAVWHIEHPPLYAAIGAASALFGVFLHLNRRRLHPRALNAALLVAVSFITVSVWLAGGETASVFAMAVFYSWTLALAFAFNSLRIGLAYFGLVAVLLAGVLSMHARVELLVLWFDLMLAIGVPALIIGYLLSTIHGLAIEDSLTGLPNRRAFTGLLPHRLALAGRDRLPVVVVMVDLDDLKSVNDASGHAAGDALLVAAARSWESQLRGGDLICRVGGDEFVLLLPDCDLTYATEVLGRMRRAAPQIAMSAGVAAWRGEEPSALVTRADAALYRAKAHGKGRIAFADDPRILDLSGFDDCDPPLAG